MKLIILGDVHCHWDGANAAVQSALKEHPDAKAVVQLGDLGDGWPTKDGFNRWTPSFDLPIYVVDGNHENFDAIEAGNVNPRLTWMKRGGFMTFAEPQWTAMFFGGATSPDRNNRTIGRSWWPQESITREQVDLALTCPLPIRAMFCHERAECFPMMPNVELWADQCGRSDRVALEKVVRKHTPRWYFHGHWHVGHKQDYDVNRFDGCINRMPAGRMFTTWVVACPKVDEATPTWTVFDGQQIWKNW